MFYYNSRRYLLLQVIFKLHFHHKNTFIGQSSDCISGTISSTWLRNHKNSDVDTTLDYAHSLLPLRQKVKVL
jgi:hypothetical protein